MNDTGMSQIRKNNTRNRILHIIRSKGKISKMDIKRISRYSMVTVLDTIEQLEKEGVIYYAEKATTKSGRRPTYIALNPEGGYFMGVSFNASEITAALLDLCGDCVDYEREELPQPLSVDDVMRRVFAHLDAMLQKHGGIRKKVLGIGIGSPGYIDEANGVSLFYPHIEDWRDIPVCSLVQEHVPDIPVCIENNTDAMALALKWLKPEEESITVIISIRSGVRMSCLLNSNLYRGKNYTVGEIGHIKVNGGSRYCPCGKKGCLDMEVTEKAIVVKILEGVQVNRFPELWDLAERDPNNISVDLFLTSVVQGHADSVALLDELCDYLGDSVTQIVNILNPANVYFNARLCELGNLFFDRMYANIRERAIFVALNGLRLAPVPYGDKTAAIGAASIVMDREFSFVDATI